MKYPSLLVFAFAIFTLVAALPNRNGQDAVHRRQATRSTIVERATRPRPKRQTSAAPTPPFVIRLTSTSQTYQNTYVNNGNWGGSFAAGGSTLDNALQYGLDANGYLYRVSDGYYVFESQLTRQASTLNVGAVRVTFHQGSTPPSNMYLFLCTITPVTNALNCQLDIPSGTTRNSGTQFYIEANQMGNILGIGTPSGAANNGEALVYLTAAS